MIEIVFVLALAVLMSGLTIRFLLFEKELSSKVEIQFAVSQTLNALDSAFNVFVAETGCHSGFEITVKDLINHHHLNAGIESKLNNLDVSVNSGVEGFNVSTFLYLSFSSNDKKIFEQLQGNGFFVNKKGEEVTIRQPINFKKTDWTGCLK